MKNLSKVTFPLNASIRESMQAIDDGAVGAAIQLDDENKPIGVITDGDIRRALLAGADLDDRVTAYVSRDFISVNQEVSRNDILDMMKVYDVEQIPVVNDAGEIVGLQLIGEIIGGDILPNWAVVMAGGKGTRLGELTKSIPKPMLQVAGRPILERIVLHLVGSGIRRIYLSVHYLSQIIEDHFGDGSKFGCEIKYLREEEALGSGGSLSLMEEKPEHPILVMNGDLVSDFNVRKLIKHQESDLKSLGTVGLKSYAHNVPYGCVNLDGLQITSMREKPTLTEWINAGIYALSPELLSRVEKRFYPITELFEKCLEMGEKVSGIVLDEDWIDVGQPAELSMARERLNK